MNPPFKLGLIGFPLTHSRSPELHHAALRASGLSGEYRLYPIEPMPEGHAALRAILHQLRTGELQGLNVTIPHKQNVLPYLDLLSPAASAVGAANTLFMDQHRLAGDNTDIPGFLADLKRCLPGAQGRALVLGAGGSARAVVYALMQTGWQVMVAARRITQAEELLQSLPQPEKGRAIPLNAASLAALRDLTLIVNATPAGMFSFPEASPWPEEASFPPGAALYDLIYNPPETRLMQQARAAGLRAFNGLGMLVEQAALSFERWTGATADRAAMWQAVIET